jgi:hypothetical protein
MFDRQELYARGCVRTLVEIIEQAQARWAARAPMVLDDSSVGALLLWTFVRWERRFPLTLLEEMSVDLWALTRDVDGLLEGKRIRSSQEHDAHEANAMPAADPATSLRDLMNLWLNRAADESRRLGHGFLGAEHLLLALVAGDTSLSSLFAKYGIDYERLKEAVLEALAGRTAAPAEAAVETLIVPGPSRNAVPWGAAWDRNPAVGVSRKFSMAVLMMMVTLFAVLFSTLCWLNADAGYYAVFGVLIFGVAMGQMFLFGGKYPRAASVWSGAALLPLEIGVLCLFMPGMPFIYRCFTAVIYMILAVPLGALCGYLAGGLAAGVVLLLELKKDEEPLQSDDSADADAADV